MCRDALAAGKRVFTLESPDNADLVARGRFRWRRTTRPRAWAMNPDAVRGAFDDAWAAVVRPGTLLHRAGLTRGYLRDEVTAVLKGRGIDTFAEYRTVERTGRRTAFTSAMREQAWALREATRWGASRAAATSARATSACSRPTATAPGTRSRG